jgi:hypothetical protein
MSRIRFCASNGALAAAFVTVTSLAAAQAQQAGVVNQPRLSAHLANQVVGDTVAICAQRKYNVVAIIVDLDGVRQAMLRGNGAPIHSVDMPITRPIPRHR